MSYSDCRALLTMSSLPTAAQYVTPGSLCHDYNIAQMPALRGYGLVAPVNLDDTFKEIACILKQTNLSFSLFTRSLFINSLT